MSIVREMSGSVQLAAAAGTCWLVVVVEVEGKGGLLTGERTEMEQKQLQ